MIFFIAPFMFDRSIKSMPEGSVVIIQLDGTRVSVTENLVNGQPTLDGLYKHIQCALVEIIELPNYRGHRVQMIVDEEGLIKRLEMNPIASGLAQRHIVGTAVILIGDACWD